MKDEDTSSAQDKSPDLTRKEEMRDDVEDKSSGSTKTTTDPSPEPAMIDQSALSAPKDAPSPSTLKVKGKDTLSAQDKTSDLTREELLCELKALEANCAHYFENARRDHKELTDLKKLLSEAELEQYKKVVEAEGIKDENRKERHNWQGAFRKKDEHIQNLEQHLKTAQNAANAAHQNNRDIKIEAQRSKESAHQLKKNATEANLQAEKLLGELDVLNKRLVEAEKAKSSLQTRCDDLEAITERQKGELNALETVAKVNAEAQLEERNDAIANDYKLEELTKKVADLEADNQTLRQNRQEKFSSTANLEQELSGADDSLCGTGDDDSESVDETRSSQLKDGSEPLTTSLPADEAIEIKRPTKDVGIQTTKVTTTDAMVQVTKKVAAGSTQTKRPQSTHRFAYGIVIFASILLLLMAAFTLYHGLQARAERHMWLAANDISRRGVIQLRASAARGERVPWLTPTGINQLKYGYSGGFKRGGMEM